MFERRTAKQRSDETSDAALHESALRGNGDAMAALYRRHGGLVYRFTLRMSQNASVAEEVTQEVFLALPTWLCGIARRQLWKHLERFDENAGVADEDDATEAESLDDSPMTLLMRQ